MNPELLLEDPKAVVEEPLPRPETPRGNAVAQAIADWKARDKSLRDKVVLENEERRDRGPKVGHNVFYNEIQKRIASRMFLFLETEGKKSLTRKISILKCQSLSLGRW